jgi:DNA-binding PadR family transcriptional regulator
MTSAVNWALLGLIIESPGYGRQLEQRFERAYDDVLPLKAESHVYSALNALLDRGYVEEVPPETSPRGLAGTDRQPRQRYAATQLGIADYRDWVLTQMLEDRRQSKLFIRQLAVFAREPQVGLEIINRFAEVCAARAREAGQVSDPADFGTTRTDLATTLAARLTAEEERLAMQDKLIWSDSAREMFEALLSRADDHAARD